MSTLYETIMSLCEAKGIKGGKMCTDIGISKSMLSDLKNGRKKTLSAETLAKIADYFDIPVEDLMGMELPTEYRELLKIGGTYLRLAREAQKLGLDDEDVDAILTIYSKHKKKNL